jgi:hypothetical protein
MREIGRRGGSRLEIRVHVPTLADVEDSGPLPIGDVLEEPVALAAAFRRARPILGALVAGVGESAGTTAVDSRCSRIRGSASATCC